MIIIILFSICAIAFVYWNFNKRVSKNLAFEEKKPTEYNHPFFSEPINLAISRIMKKPFGIKVSPSDSPVSPERFSGYHTGVDFEIFTSEESVEVPIFAVCQGPLISKTAVSGYGGVAIQKCEFNDQTIAIIYGHLQLSSIKTNVASLLLAGDQFAVLGRGFSEETSGERKHLHLGIYKGAGLSLAGYVKDKALLNGWLNIADYLPKN